MSRALLVLLMLLDLLLVALWTCTAVDQYSSGHNAHGALHTAVALGWCVLFVCNADRYARNRRG